MQIFRRIRQQRLPLVCDPLIHDGIQTRLQRCAHSPPAQTERKQVTAVDGEVAQRKAGIRRKQLIEHTPGLLIGLHASSADGRLPAGIGDVQREELPHRLDAELMHQPPDGLRFRRDGQVVIADELRDARAPQVLAGR